MQTESVRDTAEAFLSPPISLKKKDTSLLVSYYSDVYLLPMDPRRARDPRLARVDPRLQQALADPSSSSVTPTPPIPATVDALSSHQTENEDPKPPSPQSVSQPPPAETSLSSTPPNSSTPNSSYKPRPLFCIVCASNQVSKCVSLSPILRLNSKSRIGRWKAILF